MSSSRSSARELGIAVALGLLSAGSGLTAPEEVVLRGRAVCLDDGGEPSGTGAECPDEPPGGWALRGEAGALHPLSADDALVAMLTDERVRSRELQVTAWREDGGLALVHLRTVIDGRLHDPHYYCDVCAIRAHTPGLCWCCRAPFEFREPPLDADAAPRERPDTEP